MTYFASSEDLALSEQPCFCFSLGIWPSQDYSPNSAREPEVNHLNNLSKKNLACFRCGLRGTPMYSGERTKIKRQYS